MQSGMSDASIRANVIRAKKLGGPLNGESEGVMDVEDPAAPPENQDTSRKRHKQKGGQEVLEFIKQKSVFSRQLLPTEVCFVPALASALI